MDYQYIVTEVKESIAYLTVNRPERMNAMNADAWREMIDFFSRAKRDTDIGVVIITGAGNKAFIAGADIHSLAEKTPGDCLDNLAREALDLIWHLPKPVIAAIHGYAFGGGCETALACDFRIVSETAVFALPETGLGILPAAGGTQRLARLIGLGRAKDMVLLGRRIDAQEAVAIGLASKCVPEESLAEEAVRMAKKLLKKGPLALQVAKSVLNASLSTDVETGLLMETLALSALCGTEDKKEGVDAFLEKRHPSFQKR